MNRDSAFLTLLRRILIILLVLLPLGFCSYLLLARTNKAQSYKRGLAAINQALEIWPTTISQLESLRENIPADLKNDSLLNSQPFFNLLESTAAKQREKVLVEGVKVPIYIKFYLQTTNGHIVPIPGNIAIAKQEKDQWIATSVEVIAIQQDVLLADFISKSSQPTWAIDPLELESKISSNPGVLSWVLVINAPGGYEQSLAWIYQVLLMIVSFLVFFVPTYVWYDSSSRYRRSILWTSIVAFTNLSGLLVYLLVGRIPATTCPECKQAINEKQKFCPYCRVSLKTECRNCGQPLGGNWRFCASCGSKGEKD